MKLKAFLIMAGLWIGLFGLTACGGADVRTYQYPETAVLFDDFHIKKTVYSPGVMKLYYPAGSSRTRPSAATTRILKIWEISLNIPFKTAF